MLQLGIPLRARACAGASAAPARGVAGAIAGVSLKLRLIALISASIGLLTIAGGAYVVQRAQSDIRSEVRAATGLAERYVDAQIAAARADAGAAAKPAWPSALNVGALRALRHVQVARYGRAGELLDESTSDEDAADKAPAWFEALVRQALPPLAERRRELTAADGASAGYVVVRPDPSDEIAEIWNVSRGLLRLLVLFVLVINGLVWWAVGRALKPVRQVRDALGELGGGNLQARLPRLGLAELAGLSADFNRMAARLQASIAENQALTRRLIATQDDERKRIARELHDEIGQCVTAIHADAVAIQQSPDVRSGAVQASAAAIVAVTASIKEMVRGMLQRLRPSDLEGLSLEESLRFLLGAFQQRNANWACSLAVAGDANRCDAEIALAIYRVVQEALTNVARHAVARHVSVRASVESAPARAAATLVVAVEDDGAGFDPESIRGRFGLLGMRERIRALDGVLGVVSAHGAGTRIVAEVPLSRTESESR